MEKKALQEQFEEFARWYALPLDKSEDGIYRALETQSAWMSFQYQQVKVDELQEEFAEDERFLKEQIKDKDLKISNLEYQQGMDKELIQTLQGRSAALQDKVNDLQKRVEAIYHLMQNERLLFAYNGYYRGFILVDRLEQALKGNANMNQMEAIY